MLAYQPHLSYEYPLIGDEYVHLSLATYIIEEHSLPFTNPYFVVPFKHVNFESGFHFLLAGLLTIIPSEPILFYKYLVIFSILINSILVFYLVRILTKDDTAALAAMFFFGTIKSSTGFLAHQYFIPLTIGITLLLLLFIFLHHLITTREWKYALFLGGTLIATALTYPPALFFFIGTTLVYIFSMDHSLYVPFGLSRRKFLIGTASIVALLIIVFLLVLYGFDLLRRGVFPASWDVLQMHASPIFFFGIVPSTFAALGLISIAVAKSETAKILLYWFLFSLGALYFFFLFKTSILIPFPRLFMFYLLGISVLAGVGVSTSLQFAKTMWTQSAWPILTYTVVIGVVATHYSFVWAQPLSHYEILTPKIYASLKFLKEIPEKDAVVIADSATSFAIYPVSKKHVVNLLDSNVGGGNTRAAHTFLTGTCDEKTRVIGKFNAQIKKTGAPRPPLFLLSQIPQKCDFLTLVYGEAPYIYEVKL